MLLVLLWGCCISLKTNILLLIFLLYIYNVNVLLYFRNHDRDIHRFYDRYSRCEILI